MKFSLQNIFIGITLLLLWTTATSCKSMEGMPVAKVVSPKAPLTTEWQHGDTITVIATDRFKSNPIKNVFQGKNYRKAWKTPIKVPVAYLDQLEGGLKPLEMGGGMQTLSMDLEGPNGIIYTLRSVNKNPEEAIPDLAHKLNLGNLVMDAMSAQHPYGALVAAALSESINILHTNPKLVYLPSQIHLDTFNDFYKNRLFLLEYEPEGSGAWLAQNGVTEIIDTEEVQEMLVKYPNSTINERALVRARLFDLLIGDWDRHAKQWGWVVIEKNGAPYEYIPLPTDRDNAFYNPRGIFPWFINRPFSQPILRPFQAIEATAEASKANVTDWNQHKARLMTIANEITKDPYSTKHADWVSEGFTTIGKAVKMLNESHKYSFAHGQVSLLQHYAGKIDPNVLLLQQSETVYSFFETANKALQEIWNYTAKTTQPSNEVAQSNEE